MTETKTLPLNSAAPPATQRFSPRWLGLLAITLIALYLCWLIVAPFLDVILWALVLAIIAYPYHLKLRNWGMGRNRAALLSTFGVILVVLVPIALVITAMISQIPDTDKMQNWVTQAQSWLKPESRVYQWVDPYVDLDKYQDPEVAKAKITEFAKPMGQRALGLLKGFFGSLVAICFALFTLFYLLRDNHAIGQAVINTVPLDERQSRAVFDRCQQIIQASVQGVIIIAAIQGALGAIAFWVLGIGGWIVWGVIMFVMSMIPALGAAVVWIPAAIYLFATGEPVRAVILIVWGGGVIGTIDNFLRPRLVGQKAGMHDLVIFFSVLGGLQVFGILGLFVGPVVVALALSIVEVFKEVSAGFRTATPVIITDTSMKPTLIAVEPLTPDAPPQIIVPGDQA